MPNTKRLHILMDPDEYEELQRIARREGRSVADLLRTAANEKYALGREDPHAVVARIAAMNLPVDDWDAVKADLDDRYLEGLP